MSLFISPLTTIDIYTSGNISVGKTSTPLYTLDVSGNISITGNGIINGTMYSNTIFPIGTALTLNKTGGTTTINGTISGTTTTSGSFKITNSTVSSTTSSGALVVSGGVGIGGNLYVNGNISTNFGNLLNYTSFPTLSPNNIGYIYATSAFSYNNVYVTTTLSPIISNIVVPMGVYIVCCMINYNGNQNSFLQQYIMLNGSQYLSGGINTFAGPSTTTNSPLYNYVPMTVIVNAINTTNTIGVSALCSVSNAFYSNGNGFLQATRIA